MRRNFSLTLLGVCLYLMSGCAKTPTEPVYIQLQAETPLHALSEYKHHGTSHGNTQTRISIGSFPAGMKVRVVEWFRSWNAKGTDKELIQTICKEDLSKCGRRIIVSDDDSDAFTDVYGKKHDLELAGIKDITFVTPQFLRNNKGSQTAPAGTEVRIFNMFSWSGWDDKWLSVSMSKKLVPPKGCNGRKCSGYIVAGELWKHKVRWKYDAQSQIMR